MTIYRVEAAMELEAESAEDAARKCEEFAGLVVTVTDTTTGYAVDVDTDDLAEYEDYGTVVAMREERKP